MTSLFLGLAIRVPKVLRCNDLVWTWTPDVVSCLMEIYYTTFKCTYCVRTGSLRFHLSVVALTLCHWLDRRGQAAESPEVANTELNPTPEPVDTDGPPRGANVAQMPATDAGSAEAFGATVSFASQSPLQRDTKLSQASYMVDGTNA